MAAKQPAARSPLEHILDRSELEPMNVRVVPFDSEDFAGAGYSMLYLHGPVPPLDTVQIDTGHGGTFIDAESRLKQYQQRYDRVSASALSQATLTTTPTALHALLTTLKNGNDLPA